MSNSSNYDKLLNVTRAVHAALYADNDNCPANPLLPTDYVEPTLNRFVITHEGEEYLVAVIPHHPPFVGNSGRIVMRAVCQIPMDTVTVPIMTQESSFEDEALNTALEMERKRNAAREQMMQRDMGVSSQEKRRPKRERKPLMCQQSEGCVMFQGHEGRCRVKRHATALCDRNKLCVGPLGHDGPCQTMEGYDPAIHN